MCFLRVHQYYAIIAENYSSFRIKLLLFWFFGYFFPIGMTTYQIVGISNQNPNSSQQTTFFCFGKSNPLWVKNGGCSSNTVVPNRIGSWAMALEGGRQVLFRKWCLFQLDSSSRGSKLIKIIIIRK